jgi:hypothetical protein
MPCTAKLPFASAADAVPDARQKAATVPAKIARDPIGITAASMLHQYPHGRAQQPRR